MNIDSNRMTTTSQLIAILPCARFSDTNINNITLYILYSIYQSLEVAIHA